MSTFSSSWNSSLHSGATSSIASLQHHVWNSECSSVTSRTNSESFCARAERALQQVGEEDILIGTNKPLKPAPFVGREREMTDLHQAVDALLEGGGNQARVLAISGAPGSGKSTLAQQLRPRVLESNGYFLRGKFEENNGTAYSGLAMAMEDFANQIVERDWDRSIRQRLQEFLQGNETVLLDVFSGLDKIFLNDDEDAEDEEGEASFHEEEYSPPKTPATAAAASTPAATETLPKNHLKSEKEAGAQRSKRRVFFFQQFFHAVLSHQAADDASTTAPEDLQPCCIVLVLDDVQWADKSSLDLISSLVRDPDLGSLLLVTTSRPIPDDQPNHLLQQQWDSWRSERVPVLHYPLDNLCISSIDTLVAACLDCSPSLDCHGGDDPVDSTENNSSSHHTPPPLDTAPLAQIVHQRTQGNPFFAFEFLRALVDQQLLTFSYATMQWKWDNDKIHAVGLSMTDSPVDLLIAKAKRLPANQQLVLLLSSCLGGTFKAKLIRKVLKSLCAANSKNEKDDNNNKPLALLNHNTAKDVPVLETLEGFVYNGFLDRSGSSFYFVHDLIRQAAMEFVSREQLEWMRVRVGQCILQSLKDQPQQESSPQSTTTKKGGSRRNDANLFLGVDLCNSGSHLFQNNSNNSCCSEHTTRNNNLSLVDLARFNCRAGEKAMGESSFLQAVGYLKTGIQLLQQPSNNEQDEALMAKLVALAAEASYCSGNYEDMNTYAEQLLSKKDCSEETRVRMLLFKVQSATAQDFASEALDIGYAALQLLGMATFPRYPKPYHVVIELVKTKRALRNHNLQSLCLLPIVSDARREAAMEFINAMKGPAAVSNQDFLIVTFLKSIRWSVKYGLGKHSPGGFAIYGTILNAMFGETQNAIMYGEVALALAERMNLQETTAETSTLTFGMLRHWTSDMRSCYAPLVYAQKLAAECGDIETVTYCLIFGSCVMWCTAMVSLPGMGQHLQRSCAMCRDFKHWSMLEVLTNLGIHLRRLCCDENDKSFAWLDNPCEVSSQRGSVCSDATSKPKASSKDPTIELFFECMALQSHFLLGERTESLKSANLTSTMGTELCIGQSYVPRTQFYRGLVYLAPPSKGKRVTRKYLRQASRALSLLTRWAKNGNGNCIHMVTLVEAEFARVRKQITKAKELYVSAIRAAEVSGHTHDAGTAHECAAVFFLQCTKDHELAANHIGHAIRCYGAWGASAVVRRIEQSYAGVMSKWKTAAAIAILDAPH